MTVRRWTNMFFIATGGVGLLQGCKDLGSEPLVPLPVITTVLPDSAAAGDTMAYCGSDFGAASGSSRVTVGGVVADTVLSWSHDQDSTDRPVGTSAGTVVVAVQGRSSNAASFILKSTVHLVSFATDIIPVFIHSGCYACHGGSGGLFVHTVAELLQGGQHGPAIVAGERGREPNHSETFSQSSLWRQDAAGRPLSRRSDVATHPELDQPGGA